MTVDEFKREFENELYTQFNISKQLSPIDTGKLRNQGIQILKKPNGYKIYIDLSITPYAQFLDSKPKVQREHPGGFWNEICMDIIKKIFAKYGSDITGL